MEEDSTVAPAAVVEDTTSVGAEGTDLAPGEAAPSSEIEHQPPPISPQPPPNYQGAPWMPEIPTTAGGESYCVCVCLLVLL